MATMLDVAMAWRHMGILCSICPHIYSARVRRWRAARRRLEARLDAVPANADRLLRDADRRVHDFECAVDGGALRKLDAELKQTQLAYVAEHERAERIASEPCGEVSNEECGDRYGCSGCVAE